MFFFFNDPAPTEISTLSLHDALPIYDGRLPLWDKGARLVVFADDPQLAKKVAAEIAKKAYWSRSEEHTSELQSQSNLVCRLLLEKKKNTFVYNFLQTYSTITPAAITF